MGVNKHTLTIIKNLLYSIAANVFSLLVSAVVVFFVPKLIGKDDYGYWQLYLFYTSYIGIFHFGWCDGIYLRYGGAYYDKLDYRKLGQQFWMLSGLELFLSVVLVVMIATIGDFTMKSVVLSCSVCNLILVIPKTYMAYVLQTTNRIKEYSLVTILEKGFYCAGIIGLLLLGKTSLGLLVFADVLGKIVSLGMSIVSCKELAQHGFAIRGLREAWHDAKQNLKAGINLMVANLTGMLILGIIRLAIENEWSVAVFGEVSLAINLSNLLMVFINAIGIVIFPMLKRMSQDKMVTTYLMLRNALMLVLFAALTVYFPIQSFLAEWLPDYRVGIRYMAILFPVCIYESKMSLIIGPYMKALRMEKELLKSNVITVTLSVLLTGISVYLFRSLDLAMVSALLVFMVRSIICESVISPSLSLNTTMDIFCEVLITIVFCVTSWYLPGIAFFLYIFAYVLYLFYKRSYIKHVLSYIRRK